MDTFNLFRDETIGDESDPPGFRAQSAQLAPRLRASRLAMTVYEQIQLVQAFADQAAITVANARLSNAVERQRTELSRFVSPQVAELLSTLCRSRARSSKRSAWRSPSRRASESSRTCGADAALTSGSESAWPRDTRPWGGSASKAATTTAWSVPSRTWRLDSVLTHRPGRRSYQRLLAEIETVVDALPVGELELKGFARPVTAFELRGFR